MDRDLVDCHFRSSIETWWIVISGEFSSVPLDPAQRNSHRCQNNNDETNLSLASLHGNPLHVMCYVLLLMEGYFSIMATFCLLSGAMHQPSSASEKSSEKIKRKFIQRKFREN